MGRKTNIPEIGSRFKGWIVIGSPITKYNHDTYVLCRCDCGVEQEVRTYHLRCGKANHCRSCAQGLRGQREVVACGRLSLTQYSRFKASAEARSIPWKLSMEFLWELFERQKGRCALSGVELSIETYTKKAKNYVHPTASVDRIDSSGIYSEDNVQWVHKDINNMKQSFSQQQFVDMCKNVAKWIGEI